MAIVNQCTKQKNKSQYGNVNMSYVVMFIFITMLGSCYAMEMENDDLTQLRVDNDVNQNLLFLNHYRKTAENSFLTKNYEQACCSIIDYWVCYRTFFTGDPDNNSRGAWVRTKRMELAQCLSPERMLNIGQERLKAHKAECNTSIYADIERHLNGWNTNNKTKKRKFDDPEPKKNKRVEQMKKSAPLTEMQRMIRKFNDFEDTVNTLQPIQVRTSVGLNVPE